MSRKRRRSIKVYPQIVYELEKQAGIRGIKSATTLMGKILIGHEMPIKLFVMEGNKVAVSLLEYVCLAIYLRAQEQSMSIAKMAELIILGKQPGLSKEELRKGEVLEKERSEKRKTEAEKRKAYEAINKESEDIKIKTKSKPVSIVKKEEETDGDDILSGIHFF